MKKLDLAEVLHSLLKK